VYLIPKYHDQFDNSKNENDRVLADAILSSALKRKLIWALEQGDNQVSQAAVKFQFPSLDQLTAKNKKYVDFIEDTLARVVSHLIFAYEELCLIEAWQQVEKCPASSAQLKKSASYNIEAISESCAGSFHEVLINIFALDEKNWALWDSISKGDHFYVLTQKLEGIRVRFASSDGVNDRQQLVNLFRTVQRLNDTDGIELILSTPNRMRQMMNEIQDVVQSMMGAMLDRDGLFDPQNELTHIFDHAFISLKTLRPQNACFKKDLEHQVTHNSWLEASLSDHFREVYMVKKLNDLQAKANRLDVPIVALLGFGHVVSVYHFLKLSGVDVRVGLSDEVKAFSKNVLNELKEKNLLHVVKSAIEVSDAQIPLPPHYAEYLKQHKDDSEALEALELIEAYHQMIGHSVHDEL
jgi:hypothetical protein